MFIAFVPFSDKCNFHKPEITDKKLNNTGRISVALIIGDALFALTLMVVGIIGAVNGMPPAACYTMITLSCLILLAWIGVAAASRGENLIIAKELLKAAVSSDPQLNLPN